LIFVHVPVPTDPEWQEWRERAQQASKELIKQVKRGQRPEVDSDLYKEQRERLFAHFHGKCAYCEEPLDRMRGGDVEHFRPKLAVTTAADKPVLVGKGQKQHPHPGYYWLAYEWDNFLPSCVTCNQPSSPGGERLGKRNRFPVKDDFWAHAPGDEAQEQPLLLNPRQDDPTLHFLFDDTGFLIPLTPEAEACITIFGLNREEIASRRRDAYLDASYLFRIFLDAAKTGDTQELNRTTQKMESIEKGKAPYAAFARKALRAARATFEQNYDALLRLLKDPASAPTPSPSAKPALGTPPVGGPSPEKGKAPV
jgi:hypothetical protein